MSRLFRISSLVAVALAASVVLLGCKEKKAQEIVPGSPEDTAENALKNYDYKKLSYALGLSAGQYIANEEIKLQHDEFKRGLEDAINKTPGMTDDEIQDVMRNYMMTRMEAVANANSAAAKRFFDSIATQEGVQSDPSGLYYKVIAEGNGVQPTDSSSVLMNYKARFINGEEFDSNGEEPVLIDLRRVIQGWTIGIPKLKQGAKAPLYIPAELAYGARGRDRVPANATLIFDVELVKVMTPADVEAYTKAMEQKASAQK